METTKTTNNRARRLKDKWESLVNDQITKGRSYLNLGQLNYIQYVDYCYKSYCELTFVCGEETLTKVDWLYKEF